MPTCLSACLLTPPPLAPVRTIAWSRPLVWLSRALQDISKAPLISLAHGLALILIGAAILTLGHNRFWLMAGALSGFLVVGPLVATSLYAISRAIERGEVADWGLIRRTWTQWQSCHATGRGGYWCMVRFGALLALAATGWVLISASLITVMSPVRVQTLQDFIAHVVLARDGQLFVQWMALGSFLAAPIFASSVVAMPLMLDRRVTVRQAVLTSWSVVLANPGPMALWAALIVMLTLLGLGSYLLGLVVVMPLLGHASWHAYWDLVDAAAFPARDDAMVRAV
ncbi:membrane protein [Comamonas testosteroni TK102]|uniref:Membrane protein n=1 Tax=Comamonas testosteroni TK102 TaxID=1392005 RepID=A0A076PIP8_COMTE|nr:MULTISPECIES: DUF2189 domain-containing protein [Comamonas]AIJ45518.1 membrane protein [Comamonas testosteroni TK102]MPS92026.1 DUF2189 domain-containing protein [Comamonas sp.]